MTIVRKVPIADGTNPAGWNAYGVSAFSWCQSHLRDYPDSANSRITANSTARFYADHWGAPGSEFSIPTDATVNAVRVRVEAKKNTGSSCTLRGGIYIAGVWRDATAQALTTSKAEYVYEWTTNPVTSAAWTPTQINSHSATNGLSYHGFIAADATSDFDVYSMVVEVDYTPAASGPTITAQPSSQTVTAPATATFTVAATASAGSLTYQWKRNGTNIAGATAASYTTPATTVTGGTANNGDTYLCAVTDSNGTTSSSSATLTVNAAASGPTINTQPSSQTVTAPATATFTVAATSSGGALSYQWKRNGTNIAGATAASYTTPATTVTGGTANNGDTYLCAVTDSNGTTSSSSATLTVNAAAATLTSSPLTAKAQGALHLGAPFEAHVLHPTTGALVLRKTGLTSHASTGVVTFSDAALAAATQYRVVWVRTDTGAQGVELLTTT